MKGKVFVDTNIYIYFLLDSENNPEKKQKAMEIIELLSNKEIVISIQVLNEIYSILLKYRVEYNIIQEKLDQIILKTNLMITNIETIKKCWQIKLKYSYSYWDSLILASAIQEGCDILYSEDMQDNQIIDDQLKILNPLK